MEPVLGFLLSSVRADLGSSSLVSLLCLDWANKEFNLDLELEPSWKAELTTSNIIIFFHDCFELEEDGEVDLRSLVAPAMRATQPSPGLQVHGRLRLQQIITCVLDSGLASRYGWNITDASKSTSKTDVLEECLRKNKFSRGKPGNQEVEVSQKVPLDEVMLRSVNPNITN